MLGDPWFAGLVPSNHGELIQGRHQAIVSPTLWEQARRLREASARRPGKGRGRPPKGRHLFVKGHLRCGRCGGSMLPTTKPTKTPGSWYEVYECATRIRLGVEACAQTPVKRAAIDGAVMDYFANQVLDAEATRRDIEAAVEHKVHEIRELRAQAVQDEQKASERLVRIKRDYMDGKLSAEDWREFRDELAAEQEATRAKLERFTEQERSVAAEALLDAEGETLRYLAAIRKAVIDTVQDASGVEAVRAALLTVFEGFTLRRHAEPFDRDVFDTTLMGVGGGYELEPHVREDAIAGYGPGGITPKPRKIPLSRAKNNYADGLAIQCAPFSVSSWPQAPSRRERRAKDPEPVRAQDRVEPFAVVATLSESAHEGRVVLWPCEALECQARLPARDGLGVRRVVEAVPVLGRCRLIDEVGPEPDVCDPHHRDGVIEMIEPVAQRRRLPVDDERDRHHPEHASALSERLQLPVGEVSWVIAHGAAARVRD
jgi:hypothetical protein